MTYFLDTNVIIDLLNGNSNVLASFAIEKGAVLVTNNTKHFKNLSNIQLVNWKESN